MEAKKMAACIMAGYLLLITLAASHHLLMPQAGLLKKPLYGLLYCFLSAKGMAQRYSPLHVRCLLPSLAQAQGHGRLQQG